MLIFKRVALGAAAIDVVRTALLQSGIDKQFGMRGVGLVKLPTGLLVAFKSLVVVLMVILVLTSASSMVTPMVVVMWVIMETGLF